MLAVQAAEHVVLRRPLDVIANKKIKQAVAVVVEPESGRAKRQTFSQSAGAGYIHKSSFSCIVEQPVLSHACDQDVRKAVVVIVANGYAHAVHFNVQSSMGGNVGKAAISVVVVKPQRGAVLLVAGPIHPIDQKKVLPPVAVVVEKS